VRYIKDANDPNVRLSTSISAKSVNQNIANTATAESFSQGRLYPLLGPLGHVCPEAPGSNDGGPHIDFRLKEVTHDVITGGRVEHSSSLSDNSSGNEEHQHTGPALLCRQAVYLLSRGTPPCHKSTCSLNFEVWTSKVSRGIGKV
jgi:hypothetical protein